MNAGRVLLALCAGVLVAGAAYAFGVEPLFAIAWGIVVVAMVLLGLPVTDVAEPWPPVSQRPTRRGSEVARLAWSIRRDTGEVRPVVMRRVLAMIRRRSARLGVDLDGPGAGERADALLGVGTWARLVGYAPTMTDVERALDALDAVDPPRKEER